jgi:hypothetical protein
MSQEADAGTCVFPAKRNTGHNSAGENHAFLGATANLDRSPVIQ